MIGHRGLGAPGGQDVIEALALLVVLQRRGHIGADLPLASGSAPDLLHELVGKTYRDAFHTIIILVVPGLRARARGSSAGVGGLKLTAGDECAGNGIAGRCPWMSAISPRQILAHADI